MINNADATKIDIGDGGGGWLWGQQQEEMDDLVHAIQYQKWRNI